MSELDALKGAVKALLQQWGSHEAARHVAAIDRPATAGPPETADVTPFETPAPEATPAAEPDAQPTDQAASEPPTEELPVVEAVPSE